MAHNHSYDTPVLKAQSRSVCVLGRTRPLVQFAIDARLTPR
jgi:hypothetical protein